MTAEASRDQSPSTAGRSRSAWLALGAVLAAVGASTCCILPLALFTLGVSGAWIGSLTALSPYQPIFLGAALLCVGAGLVAVYRRSPGDCGPQGACANPPPRTLTKIALWSAAALILAVLLFPYVAPLFIQA